MNVVTLAGMRYTKQGLTVLIKKLGKEPESYLIIVKYLYIKDTNMLIHLSHGLGS